MYCVYVLQSKIDASLYTGFTTNIKARLIDHNKGLNISSSKLKPWKLIYFEAYDNKEDALNREKFLKSGSGKHYLDKQLKNYFTCYPRRKLT